MICWLNGNPFNWVKYVVYCGKYAMELKEMKVANLAQQVESSGVHEGKRALCPPTFRQLKIKSKDIDAKGLKNKGAQLF